MVVTRRKPVVPAPGPTSRTSSTQAVPRAAKPKVQPSGLANSSAQPNQPNGGLEKQSKKSKFSKQTKKKKKKDPSALTYLRNILLTLTTIYAILACPDSPLYTSPSSPFYPSSHTHSSTHRNLPINPGLLSTPFPPPHPLICKALLATHNKLVIPLHAHVVSPLFTQVSDAALHIAHSDTFAPYTNQASHFYQTKLVPTYTRVIVPAYHRHVVPRWRKWVVPFWNNRVLPLFNERVLPAWRNHVLPAYRRYYNKLFLPYWRKYVSRPLSPYFVALEEAYTRHVAPIVSRLAKISSNVIKIYTKWYHRAQPHVQRFLNFIAEKLHIIYKRLEPHLHTLFEKVSYQLRQLLQWISIQRRVYVDPHVVRIWIKVKELSGVKEQSNTESEGYPIKVRPEDAPIKSVGVDPDYTSALYTASTDDTVYSAISVVEESVHASIPLVPIETAKLSPSPSPTAIEPTSASSIEPTTENPTSAASIAESEASLKAEYSSVAPTVLSDAAASAAASVIEESLFAPSPEATPVATTAIADDLPQEPLELDPDGFIDLEEFIANLGLNDEPEPASSSSVVEATSTPAADDAQPSPLAYGDAPMSEEERLAHTKAKRLDITSRHSRWESELETLIESKTRSIFDTIADLRSEGVKEMNKNDGEVQVIADEMVKEGEKLLKGASGWVVTHKGAPYANRKEVEGEEKFEKEKERDRELFDKLVRKVEERFRDKVGDVEDVVRKWFTGVRDREVEEVLRVEREVKDLAERAQSDIGLDYAWLDDVTYEDWQRYHDLIRRSERFSDIARSLQNGTHASPPDDPLLPALEELRSEVQDIVNAFQARLRGIKQSAYELFNGGESDGEQAAEGRADDVSVEADKDRAPKVDEPELEPPVSILPTSSHEGQQDESRTDAISPVLLGRSEEEVVEALGRAAVPADGRSAKSSADIETTPATDGSGQDEKLPVGDRTAQVPVHVEL